MTVMYTAENNFVYGTDLDCKKPTELLLTVHKTNYSTEEPEDVAKKLADVLNYYSRRLQNRR